MERIRKIFIIIAIVCVAWLVADATFSNKRVQTRVDKMAGGQLIRSMSLSENQVIAHQLLEQNAENKNLSCLGTTPELRKQNLARMMTILNNGGTLPNESDAKCIKRVFDGPDSFGDIVKKWFAGEPEPQLIKSVQYNPRKHGVGGMKISIPGGYSKYECNGSYSQLWLSPKKHRENIGCKGMHNKNMSTAKVVNMPIEKPKIYGRVLVDIKSTATTTININIPQTPEEYSDIYGELTIDFYK